MILRIAQMVLPVLVMIGLGYLCRQKQIFTLEGLSGLKAVISNITLPVVLFSAFFTADYSWTVLLLFLVTFAACALAMLTGYALRRLAKPYGKFLPFLMTGYENGMLGYALFGLIAGQAGLSVYATIDVGQTIFVYSVYIALLKAAGGRRPGPRELAATMATNPPCIGMLLGILLGASGVGKLVLEGPAGDLAQAVTGFVSAPTAGMILLVVGYELSLKRELLRPVAVTAILRTCVMGLLCAASCLILFAVIPFDRTLFLALLLMFSLPAPFIIPLFADVGEDGEYISTSLSVSTFVSVLLFAAIAAYSML